MTPDLALGLDFGTESCRALLVRTADGRAAGAATVPFAHGVITERLPGRRVVRLPPETALQHPGDYLDAAARAIRAALRRARAAPTRIAGIGVDFTSCTVLPTDADGRPLCLMPRFAATPDAWVKLWKHHTAQAEAEELRAVAQRRGEPFLDYYGGVVSSEWLFPKALETARRAPAVYRAAARFLEAGDWFVRQLTGTERRSACQAGYKAFWSRAHGYPGRDFLRAVDPRIAALVADKLAPEVFAPGTAVGTVTPAAARRFGLAAGTPVSAASIDAHAGVPGCGVTTPGTMVVIMGTSACHMLPADEPVLFPGFAGLVWEGIVPGCYGYESGQAGFGDLLAWLVEHQTPPVLHAAARRARRSLHAELWARVAAYPPGGSGLLALDWWNGNRSVLMDARLSGLVAGFTLDTRVWDLYHALWEACAFGTRRIIEGYTAHGVPVRRVVAAGGIPRENPALVQLFADVCGRPFEVAAGAEPVALGAAIFGAVAAGAGAGGHDRIAAATRRMAPPAALVCRPRRARAAPYDRLYRRYLELHDRFGRESDLMPALRLLRADAR